MIKLKNCPKCTSGTLLETHDEDVPELWCIQCGYRVDLAVPRHAVESVRREAS